MFDHVVKKKDLSGSLIGQQGHDNSVIYCVVPAVMVIHTIRFFTFRCLNV